MNKQFLILIILFLSSCLGNKSTFDSKANIERMGMPIKLEYYKHLQGRAFHFSDTATFILTDNQELKTAITEIENADNPEPWKGAGWDIIKIYFPDTTLIINTNGKKIGLGASGTFYDLDKDNFITKH